jgi:hypothetical protein
VALLNLERHVITGRTPIRRARHRGNNLVTAFGALAILNMMQIEGVDGYHRRSVKRIIVSSGPANHEIIDEAI